ncbi:hypothetical protein C8Q70DRAFT_909094 [Cubamyces menziesii]|nr:hypothetical protein C8Q70DRAFT_909094 [Cubamyces menziesii]
MPIPMLVMPDAPDIVIDVEVTQPIPAQERSESAPLPEEPLEELSRLGQEIDRHYGSESRDVSGESETPVEELTNIRVDPAIKHIDIKQAIEYGVDRFADSIPLLKKALSEISKIHPVVTVAVLAFEAVIELEMTRRENDRRVTVLFVEMKEVMTVVTHFKELHSNDVGHDGIPLNVRLRELAEGTAEDIKQCANLCDAFLKSKLLLRVLKGPLWAERFASSMARFARRKEEYNQALGMHTASTVTKMAVDIESINIKMQLMHDFFEKYMTVNERNLAAQVEKEGGATRVRHEDAILKKLMGATGTKLEPAIGPVPEADRAKAPQQDTGGPGGRMRAQVKGPDKGSGFDGTFGLDDLKRELREDLDDTIERNFTVFLRKYEFQAQLMSDRIIHAVEAAVSGGTHSRIKNADLQRIWKEMNWTGVVKGRILVHALREHYYNQDDTVVVSPDATAIGDKWALDYLNVAWLSPILEAMDDDVSGYISVSEVNRFMQRLPQDLGWSLPTWLAYWAVGWRCATSKYLAEIQRMIEDFHTDMPSVLAVNRPSINAYLKITPVWTLLAGMERYDESAHHHRFQQYIDSEEARIKANLEKFNYRIDARDTLKLVIGSARIERCIAPLFCLLMRNDLRKLRLARWCILAKEEFESSTTSMSTIDAALCDRCDELRETFTQRKLDANVEIKKFACGILTYFSRELTIPGEWWTNADTRIDIRYSSTLYRDPYASDESDTSGVTILKEMPLDTAVYDSTERETEEDLTSHPLVSAIVGQWHGFLYEPGLYPSRPMTTLFFHAAPPKPKSNEAEKTEGEAEEEEAYSFKAEGTDYEGSEYIVTGTCTASEEGIKVYWCMEYDGDVTLYFNGRILDEFTLSGNQSYNKDVSGDAYLILKKAPAEYLRFRPGPAELESQPYPFDYALSDVTPQDKARALWNYAISAIRDEVRRKRWTWSYFQERRRVRKLWLSLRSSTAGNLNDYELREVHLMTTPADARLYNSMTEHNDRMLLAYDNWVCDAPYCAKPLRLAVVICLQCLSDDFRCAVAFCDDPACYSSEREGLCSATTGLPHLCTHDMVKCRSLVLIPYLPSIQQRAFNSLRNTQDVLRLAEDAQDAASRISVISSVVPEEEDHEEAEGAPASPVDAEEVQIDAPSAEQTQPDCVDTGDAEGHEPAGQPSLAVPQEPAATLSRWSFRSLLSTTSLAHPWSRKTAAAPEPSAAEASSTLAVSHDPEPVPSTEDTTARDEEPRATEDERPATADANAPGVGPISDAQSAHSQEAPEARVDATKDAPDADHGDAGRDNTDAPDEAADDNADASSEVASLAVSEYATAASSIVTIIPSEAASSWNYRRSPTPPPRPPQCHICSERATYGFWYCIECWEFICPECDKKHLIRCVACEKPFPQPSWYYGSALLDDFRCDVCTAHRAPALLQPTHVCTHTVVLCKPSSDPPPSGDAPPGSPAADGPGGSGGSGDGGKDHDREGGSTSVLSKAVDERLAAMEDQLGSVRARLDGLDGLKEDVAAVGARLEAFDALQSQVAEIHAMLARLVGQKKEGTAASGSG